MEEKVARLIECERVIRKTQAERLRLIAELNVDEWADRDIGMALQLSSSTASSLVTWATRVATVFPDVVEAMEAGVISEWSAHGLVDPTEHYSREVAQKAVAKTLETAAGRCCQQLRRSVQGRLQRADPAGHAQRCAERRRDRSVVIYDLDDGMAVLKCEQPVEVAQAMYAKVDRLARQEPKNGRSMDAIRADVLASLVLQEPQSAGSKALIQVTVPITALLGVDDRPGQLDTGQLLPADVVRDLMTHPGTLFHRLLTDPAGQLLEYSPGIYRPKADVDRFIRTRHRTCVMPCCSHPSRSCDIDHAIAWPEGTTTGTNLGPLDRRHHRYKHATNAKVVIADDGTTTIQTRWGQTYTTKPDPVEEPPF
ncbi:HNH endonuclease signature motif containing protein [Kutzneria sp. CA-103260]|uniref:HNH endonuclease signature motif containing protein n=1 Tax=Kutzneria sp. CA-103260 TaxID=2802641 RepID=UPI001BA7BE7B|nr:HNH endonuclease signature motif containing protein [Kutzneria sp. CA-103260]